LGLQSVTFGDVLDHADREAGGAVLVTDERDHQVGPDLRAVAAVVALLRPEAVVLAADESRQHGPHLGGVRRVQEVGGGEPVELLAGVAEHVAECLIDVHDPAVEATDTDTDRRLGEDRLEACLARPAGPFRLGPRGEHGAVDLFLLGQSQVTQRLRVTAGQRAEHPPQPGVPTDGHRVRREFVAERGEGAGQRRDVGEVRGDQRLPDLTGGADVLDVRVQQLDEPGHPAGQPSDQVA
jgi:hypothetical protein